MQNNTNIRELVEHMINSSKPCSCGRDHTCRLSSFRVADTSSEKLISEILDQYGVSRIHFISSQPDMDVLGNRVLTYISSLGYHVTSSVFPPESEFVCDHVSAGDLLIHVPDDAQLIIATGEKTICDLAKFVSSKDRIPFIFLPTSASTDTFSMSEAEFTENDRRVRLQLSSPNVIVADLSVLQNATMDKTASGVSCVMASLVSLADWRLHAEVTGSYFCQVVFDELSSAIRQVLISMENGVSPRDRDLMEDLISCLIACGISSDICGTTAPIRGTESCIARKAEMLLVSENITGVSFETLRGISALYAVKLYEYLEKNVPSFESARAEFNDIDRVYFHKELFRVFGDDEGHRILSSLGGENYYQRAARLRRLDKLETHLGEYISSAVRPLLSSSRITSLLHSSSSPLSFRKVGLMDEEIADVLVWGKELSKNYGIARLLADLMLLEQAVSDTCRF